MELSTYFEPVDTTIVDFQSREFHPTLGDCIAAYTEAGAFPEWKNARLALLGVKEDRGSVDNSGCAAAPDHIRRKLYRLAKPHADTSIVDLGNPAPRSATPTSPSSRRCTS